MGYGYCTVLYHRIIPYQQPLLSKLYDEYLHIQYYRYNSQVMSYCMNIKINQLLLNNNKPNKQNENRR